MVKITRIYLVMLMAFFVFCQSAFSNHSDDCIEGEEDRNIIAVNSLKFVGKFGEFLANEASEDVKVFFECSKGSEKFAELADEYMNSELREDVGVFFLASGGSEDLAGLANEFVDSLDSEGKEVKVLFKSSYGAEGVAQWLSDWLSSF